MLSEGICILLKSGSVGDTGLSLAELLPGDKARVRFLSSSRAKTRRIMMLGINPGALVKMVRRAPLGDPLEFEVNGCLLTLRQEDASFVFVEEVERG